MKKNSLPFNTPTRQSVFAIILIIQKFIRVIIRQIWPVLVVFVVGGGSSKKDMILYFVVGIAIISMIWAIIAYFKFTFYLEGDELIVDKGVIKRTKTNIPFGRIQTVNFQQNLLHRIFNVIQLDVDTAGSQGSEFSFEALSHETAQSLRKILLSESKSAKAPIGEDPLEADFQPPKLVFQLEFDDLFKVGISQNHLKSFALIFAGAYWVFESLDDLGYVTRDKMESLFENSMETQMSIVVFLGIILLFVSFLISLFRTVFRFYDLKLFRQNNRYQLVSGLITRKEVSIIDHKIQIIEWSDNLIKKAFKFFDVKLKQASSIQVLTKKSIFIPGCTSAHIEYIKKNWLGESVADNFRVTGVTIHYFYRRLLYRMLFCGALLAILWVLEQNILFFLSLMLVPYFVYTSWIAFKKAGFGINEDILYICKGMFGDDYSIMPIHKIQSLKILQTPYQNRKNLSNLKIFTASGNVQIPYLHLETATKLYDYLIYKTEISRRPWM